jgi:hypothetical protein
MAFLTPRYRFAGRFGLPDSFVTSSDLIGHQGCGSQAGQQGQAADGPQILLMGGMQYLA